MGEISFRHGAEINDPAEQIGLQSASHQFSVVRSYFRYQANKNLARSCPPVRAAHKLLCIRHQNLCGLDGTCDLRWVVAGSGVGLFGGKWDGVGARVSEEVKAEVAAIFEAADLTSSDAIGMMRIRAVEDGALAFDPVKPNVKTVHTIRAARAGKGKKAKSSKQLIVKLNARD